MPVMYQARETFVAELKDGSPLLVAKGSILHEGHELVKRDKAGSGLLFAPLDTGDDKPARTAKRGSGES